MTKLAYTKADINALQAIGLTKTQARCYLLLTSSNGLPAGHIVHHLGVSRTSVYPTINDLKQKGFVTELAVLTPNYYYFVPLATALVAYSTYQREQVKQLLIKQQTTQL